MSVQTQIDRINSEVTSQTSLISQIQTALEGKAAGGGTAVETCTVTFNYQTSFIGGKIIIAHYLDENSEYGYYQMVDAVGHTEQIVKNSLLVFSYSDSVTTTPNIAITGDAEVKVVDAKCVIIVVTGDATINPTFD